MAARSGEITMQAKAKIGLCREIYTHCAAERTHPAMPAPHYELRKNLDVKLERLLFHVAG